MVLTVVCSNKADRNMLCFIEFSVNIIILWCMCVRVVLIVVIVAEQLSLLASCFEV